MHRALHAARVALGVVLLVVALLASPIHWGIVILALLLLGVMSLETLAASVTRR